MDITKSSRENKLFRALSALPPEDSKAFLHFLQSPYFNRSKPSIRLIELKYSADPSLADPAVLHAKLFGDKPFSQKRLVDLQSEVMVKLKEFLAVRALQSRPTVHQTLLLRKLRELKWGAYFEQEIREAEKKIPPRLNAEEKLEHLKTLYEEADLFFLSLDSRSKDKSIEKKATYLDGYYLLSKLRMACDMKNRQYIIQEDYAFDFMEEVLEMSRQYLGKEILPALAIYRSAYFTLTEPEERTHYDSLLALLDKHDQEIEKSERSSMYDFARNYCIRKINAGESHYLKELLSLYKKLISNGVMYGDNGALSPWDYKNVITVAIRLKDLDWIEQFVESETPKLPKEERENAYLFNKANIQYARQQYGKAISLLQGVEFTDIFYALGARATLLKAYYESDETEALLSLLDAFRKYLKRNQTISIQQLQANINLIDATKKLTLLRNRMFAQSKRQREKELQAYQKYLSALSPVSNKTWLEEQLSLLNK